MLSRRIRSPRLSQAQRGMIRHHLGEIKVGNLQKVLDDSIVSTQLVLVHVFDGQHKYREYAEEQHQGNHGESYQSIFDSFALAFALGVYFFHIGAYVSTRNFVMSRIWHSSVTGLTP